MGAVTDELKYLLRVYWSLLLGNVVEWYEFAIYAYLESFMEEKFFKGSAVATWLGFGMTFIARPIGGAIFGAIGDKCGRSVSMNLTIIGMLVATCGQGMLPTYASGEVAGNVGVSILLCLRVLQGVSAAGEIGTIATYIVEVGRQESLGRSMSLVSITVSVGFLAAKAVCFTLTSLLGAEAMRDWGWRLPFILAAIPGLISVAGRRGMPESSAFLEQQAEAEKEQEAAEQEGGAETEVPHSRSSMRQVVADNGPNIWIGFGAVACAATMGYGGYVWTNVYLGKRGMSQSGTMITSMVTRLVSMALAFPLGWVVDRKGVAWLMFVASCGVAVLGLPCFILLDAFPTSLWVSVPVVGICFAVLGSGSGCCFLYVVELFPTASRATAMGISYNLGMSIFGGLAPMLCEASLRLVRYGPGFVLSLAGLWTSVTILTAQILKKNGVVKLTHVRERPYFSSKRLLCRIGDGPAEVGSEDVDVHSDSSNPDLSD